METQTQTEMRTETEMIVLGGGHVDGHVGEEVVQPPVLIRTYATGDIDRNLHAFINYTNNSYNYVLKGKNEHAIRALNCASEVLDIMISTNEWNSGYGIDINVLCKYRQLYERFFPQDSESDDDYLEFEEFEEFWDW